jgi:protein-tyrosine phosphatase
MTDSGIKNLLNFIDIHSHILPGVDDGAKDMATALEMLRLAAAAGTRCIVSTPHFISDAGQYTPEIIGQEYQKLQKVVVDEGLGIAIYPGCEVFISPDIPELYDRGILSTINGSCYMLIELPMMSVPAYTDEVLYQLQLRGLAPIIAHPERNSEISRNPGILTALLQRGMLAQVNSSSITGIYGDKVQDTAYKLIKANMAHFVASDAHTCRGRSPKLVRAAELVEKECGMDTVRRLFYENGLAVLENRDLPAYDPVNIKNVRNFFKDLLLPKR